MLIKRPLLFIAVSLFIGAIAGFSFLLLEKYAAKELLGLLADEIRSSGDYDLVYDSVELSLIQLKAKAKNVRIISTKEPAQKTLVFVKILEASFSIKNILDRTADLSEIKLIDSDLSGVGPDSAIFNIVNYLATPIPAEKDTPDRFTIKLHKLTLTPSRATEKIGLNNLSINGLKINLERDQHNNFNLSGSLKTAELKNSSGNIVLPIFQLNDLKTDIYLADEYIAINRLDADFPGGHFLSTLNVEPKNNDKVNGQFNLAMDSGSLALQQYLEGVLNISGNLAGYFSKPEINADIISDKLKIITPEQQSKLEINNLKATLKTFFEQNLATAVIDSLNSDTSSTIKVELKAPLKISSDGLSGAVEFSIPLYDRFKDAKLSVTLNNSSAVSLNFSFYAPTELGEERIAGNCSYLNHNLECKINSDNQSVIANLKVSLPSQSLANIDSAQITLQKKGKFKLNSQISGPANFQLLKGSGQFELEDSTFGTVIDLKLDNGRFNAKSIPGSAISVNAESNLTQNFKSKLEIAAKQFNLLGKSGQNDQCHQISFKSELIFQDLDPKTLTGFADISNFGLGCAPYDLKLTDNVRVSINGLNANLPASKLISQYGEIKIEGQISSEKGINFSANGSTSLSALLPFVPDADELSGQLKLNVNVSGKIDKPVIAGQIEIDQGIFESSSSAIEAHGIKGKAVVDEKRLQITALTAELNSGQLSVSGGLNFSEISNSEIKAKFSNVYLQPIDDSELIISGELSLLNSTPLTIKGDVEIESFDIVKRLNLLATLKNLPTELINSKPKKILVEKVKSSSNTLVDIKVHADDAIFLDSNFAQIEAMANLHLTGDISKPAVAGEVEVLQGWFGLRDRRFEIGSGKAIFIPGSDIPNIEILAESSVFTRQGENVMVFASITGQATSPEIKLDSDRGLTEKELLNLLTSGADISNSGSSLSVLPQNDDINLPFISDDSFFGLGRWIRRLTKIDSVSIEPTFNAISGVVEPMLVAIKKLTPEMNLRGETSFGGSSYTARARINYGLTQRTTVSGILESLASQDVTTLGVDVSYAFKPLKSLLLDFSVIGNFLIADDSILVALKLTEDSRVTADSLSRLSANLKEFYYQNGFRQTEVSLVCEKYNSKDICEKLKIIIDEGQILEFSGLRISGDSLPENLIGWFKSVKDSSGSATSATKDLIVSELIARLRNEGFIRSRVQGEYLSDNKQTILNLNLRLGKPVSFNFQGNSIFSNLELLEAINLFTRKQPFGNNTINLLTRNISQLYRQSGYLQAEVNWQDISTDNNREVYLVSIIENNKISLNQVKFSIEGELTEQQINDILHEYLQKDASSILRPKKLLLDTLENNCQILTALLKTNGYNVSVISYDLDINKQENQADLTYFISLQNVSRFQDISISGVPADLTYESPTLPVSSLQASRFVEDLNQQLKDKGYYLSEIKTEADLQKSIFIIRVIPGEPAAINSIKIEGLSAVSENVVREKITFENGAAVDINKFAEVRSRLLRTGLFAKVSIDSADGKIDQPAENIIIKVEERNLQTMQVGTGINSEYGLHIFGAMTDREFFSDGRSLSARVDSYLDQLQGSVSQGVISLNYSDPEFIGQNIGAVDDLRFQRLDLSSQEFDLDRLSHAFYLHRNFDEYISATLGHTLKFDNLDNVNPSAILDPEYDSGSVRLGMLNSKMLFDYRDNPLNPRQGYAVTLSPQLALKAFGSEAQFTSLELKFQKIFDLDGILDDFDLSYTNRLASAWTLGNLDYIPITERYYAGGRNSVRGFRENSLGPKAADGAIIGGDQLINQSLEFRYFIIEDATINLFLDSARLMLKDYAAEGEDFRYSAGVGTRYLSPIGPIGFDVGFPLDEKSGEPSVRLHFSIGANF